MSSSPQNQPNDPVTADKVIAALEGYRHLFAPEDIGKVNNFSKPATIYMSGQNNVWQPFYRDPTPHAPGIQKLSDGQLKLIKWVTAESRQNPEQEKPLHENNGNLRIDVGAQTVFTMAGGYVRYNALKDIDTGQENTHIQPSGEWPNASNDKKKQATAAPSVAAESRTAAAAMPEAAAPPRANDPTITVDTATSPDMPSSPGKGLTSTTLNRYLDQLETQVVQPITTEYAKSRLAQTRWQAAQYERSSNQNKRILVVAQTLLKHYGVAEGHHLTYTAENYQIAADARTILISDKTGTPLFEAHKTIGSRYKVATNTMSADHALDFNKVAFLLEKVGIQGLSADPRLRKQQLDALAPRGDKAMAQDLITHTLGKTAERFLAQAKVQPNADGTRELRGQYYTISQKDDTLKISAAGRGVILNIGPKVNSNSITSKDIAYFRSLSQRHLPGRRLRQTSQLER